MKQKELDFGLVPTDLLVPVTLKISFENLLGKRSSEISAETRQARWEEWKALAGQDAAEWWEPDPEACGGCVHLAGDWCRLMELPAAVNPILSFRFGMPGMACMGAGKETLKESDSTPDDDQAVDEKKRRTRI